MANGKEIDLADAKKYIRKFVNDEIARTGKPEIELVVGHLMDLSLMKKFITHIEGLNSKGNHIDGVRIYYAKRPDLTTGTDVYDIVLVPVLMDGNDYYHVYDRPTSLASATTMASTSTTTAGSGILSDTRPCPNQCG